MLKFSGVADGTARFLQKNQLSDPALWAKFVDLYRSQPDGENLGWRGEYWGKMMRGATLVYKYTRDEELHRILTDSVRDMLTVAEEDGRVSTYSRDTELDGWDMWSRKYVMLACEYYLEICRDGALAEEILRFISGCADYVIARVGPGRMPIASTSRSWRGINSSSILEPIVRLYRLTGEARYLDFAAYIIESGGADGINVFELAYENKIYPYQYGVSKAYELTSCFEGLLEYYLVTGEERYRIAVENYARAVIASEVSIIGSCGITHELFDHTRVRQTVEYDGVKQETCVTVTWMKFCSALLRLTGDSIYADEMERSFYNAYLGAVNFERNDSRYIKERFAEGEVVSTYLPFDSYSPLTPARRGDKVGGTQVLPDGSYYGCCACIGSAGVGVFLDSAVVADAEGVTVNFFERGSFECEIGGVGVRIAIDTDYPVCGRVRIGVSCDAPVEFVLKVRHPGWASGERGYKRYDRVWQSDTVETEFDMPTVLRYPEHWEEDVVYVDTSRSAGGADIALPKKVYHDPGDDNYVAVTRGPLVLAADERLGKDPRSVFSIRGAGEPSGDLSLGNSSCMLKLGFGEGDEKIYLVDYASAGRDWESVVAAWIPTANE